MAEFSPRELAAELRRRSRAFRGAIYRAENATAAEAMSQARRLSSGLVSPRLLRKERPFARRHGSPQLDVLPLNVGRGGILFGWQISRPRIVNGDLVYTLTNVAPHAKYQYDPESQQADGGTKFTFGRPIPQAVAEAIAPGRLRRLQDALDTFSQP